MARNLNLRIIASGAVDLKSISEYDFQGAVLQYARSNGWKTHHMYKSAQMLRNGEYRGLGTPGWPDVICVRDGTMLCLELKSERGTATAEQKEWLSLLRAIPGVSAGVYKPRQAGELMEALK